MEIKFKTSSSNGAGTGWIEVERPKDNNRRGFTIRGRNTSNTETDLLYHFTNSDGGDAINYVGRVTGNSNIVTKKHVDDNFVKGNFTITKSNGNYYVQ